MQDGEEKLLIAAAAPALIAAVLQRFGGVRLRVSGTSMLPAIRPGDTLSVHACAIGDVVPGDIVLFTARERLFVHRVTRTQVRASSPFVVTKGDALAADDPPVLASHLLGRVTHVERRPPVFGDCVRYTTAGVACERVLRVCRGALRRARFDRARRRSCPERSEGVEAS